MSSWRPTDNATYERPLGFLEQGFYWDSAFGGTADTIQHGEIEIRGDFGRVIYDRDNVARAWASVKQQFPLLAARIREDKDGQVSFVVSKARLQNCSSGDLEFHEISSREDAQLFALNVVNLPRLLCNDQISKVFILLRKDHPGHFHIVIHASHVITDGIANSTLLRTFIDRLSTLRGETWDLEERLALAVPSEMLTLDRRTTAAGQRWRRATAHIITTNRQSKLSGGHTLPRAITKRTPYTPASSGLVASSFSIFQSATIIQNCRNKKLTFGNAYPVLAQVALTRVLCRRYAAGQIDENEWSYRRREPTSTGGPLNLRPFLDSKWFLNGGSDNVCCSIGFFYLTLPFMPLGTASNLAPGDAVPNFQELLSPPRFFLRCNMIKKQLTQITKHPLFLDIAEAQLAIRLSRLKDTVLNWRVGKFPQDLDNKILSAVEQPLHGPVMGHGGSSFGNVDRLIPLDYPADRKPEDPTLHLINSGTTLHCRPNELYLGAVTSRQQMSLHVYWDRNVYEEDIIKEWLEEVKLATEFYLGQDDPNRHSRL